MALNDITINRGKSGLGRPLTGKDHYSSILFYHDTLPSGFGSSDRIKKIYSIGDAENLGIVDDHSDETVPTGGNVLITLVGGTGSIWTITLDGAVLGSYTEEAGDAVNDVATGLRAAVNALTLTSGYSAAGATANIALTAPAKMGIAINSGSHLASANDATGTTTDTQFSSGVGSYFAVMHYHISEYFRLQPKGVLWIGIYAQGTYDGTEIQTIQDYANGDIREMAVFISHESYASSHVTASQTYCSALQLAHKPLSVMFHSDMSAATLANFTDLGTLASKNISVIIGAEGDYYEALYSNTKSYLPGDKVKWIGKIYQNKIASTGNAPFNTDYWFEVRVNLADISGFSISNVGACLGFVSLASVQESIGWVEKFNLVTGTGLDNIAFATGDLYTSVSTTLLDTLNDYHYVFMRKFQEVIGSYFNDSYTAIVSTSDYATIENNRTMDKAERNVYAALITSLNSPLYLNDDGTMTDPTVHKFINLASTPLDDMEVAGEVSGYSVTVDPAQDVLATDQLVVSFVLLPVGVARRIVINSGFTTKII